MRGSVVFAVSVTMEAASVFNMRRSFGAPSSARDTVNSLRTSVRGIDMTRFSPLLNGKHWVKRGVAGAKADEWWKTKNQWTALRRCNERSSPMSGGPSAMGERLRQITGTLKVSSPDALVGVPLLRPERLFDHAPLTESNIRMSS